MRSLILFLGLIFSSSLALAHLSPARGLNETYEQARHRSQWIAALSPDFSQHTQQNVVRHISVERAKVALHSLDTTSIPEMPSYEVMENEFKYVRDTRFLKTSDANFPRRLSWLYPDDGCYARAEVSKRKLVEHQMPAPKKIFVFGNLFANTTNTPTGTVSWWYHVAVTYRVGSEVYIFDASIDPTRPMTLNEWNHAVGGNQASVQYSVCAPNAYDPGSDCDSPREVNVSTLMAEQNSFLRPEWDRVKKLNRDPHRELGEFPPWLN